MKQRRADKKQGGKRVDWEKINRPADCPVITIITSTYNASEDLPWTINSIKSQKYPYIQWIVVDGASKDGTVKLLEDNSDIIDVWISEPDKGIYDAWNKATKYIKGDWVQFVGAGDEYNDPLTLLNISKLIGPSYPNHDIAYGRLKIINRTNRRIIEEVGEPWEKLRGKWELFRPMLPVHPEVFHHSCLFKEDKVFDKTFKVAGDCHFLMKQIPKKDFLYIPINIIKMTDGGVSGKFKSFILATLESRRASKILGFKPPISHCIREGTKFSLKLIILSLYPEKHQPTFRTFST